MPRSKLIHSCLLLQTKLEINWNICGNRTVSLILYLFAQWQFEQFSRRVISGWRPKGHRMMASEYNGRTDVLLFHFFIVVSAFVGVGRKYQDA